MKRANMEFARPHGFREFEFVRAGPDGAYWHAADGMVVRVAAAERGRAREAEALDTSLPRYEIARGRAGACSTGFARAEKWYGRGGFACGLNAPGS
jgi:hypothetical protein